MKVTDRGTAGEIILEVLAEGGSLTLLGIKTANGWRFRLDRDESTLADLLNEEDRKGMKFKSASAWVGSWEEALALLDEYRWHRLYPGLVHPDFKRKVCAAVKSRSSGKSPPGSFWRRLVSRKARAERRRANAHLDRWQRVCSGKPPHPGKGSITFG